MEQSLPTPSLQDLRIDEVDEHRWRVSDRRLRATHPRELLGFIVQIEDQFEVSDLHISGGPTLHASREAAIATFTHPRTNVIREPELPLLEEAPQL